MPVHTVPFDLVELGDVERTLQRRNDDETGHPDRTRVLVIVNGKGGVGKSSLASAIAVAIAKTKRRVLLIEVDEQGNNAEDLGYTKDPVLNDDGAAQKTAILEGKPLQPTGTARPNLYVVPGGSLLEDVVEELYCQRRLARVRATARGAARPALDENAWMGMYAAAIEPVRDDYDLIILDVAPGSEVLQLQALVAGDSALIPSRSDPSSRKGLRTVARRFAQAREHNPFLRILGVVLFATNSSATKVHGKIVESLQKDLRGSAPVFEQSIRYVEAAAVKARELGRVPQELRSSQDVDAKLRPSMKLLAGDYQSLSIEVMQALAELHTEDEEDDEA
jgi:cellulose biosynthesis protein BcsQ